MKKAIELGARSMPYRAFKPTSRAMQKTRNAPNAPRFRPARSKPVQTANAPYTAITPNGMGILSPPLRRCVLASCREKGLFSDLRCRAPDVKFGVLAGALQ